MPAQEFTSFHWSLINNNSDVENWSILGHFIFHIWGSILAVSLSMLKIRFCTDKIIMSHINFTFTAIFSARLCRICSSIICPKISRRKVIFSLSSLGEIIPSRFHSAFQNGHHISLFNFYLRFHSSADELKSYWLQTFQCWIYHFCSLQLASCSPPYWSNK